MVMRNLQSYLSRVQNSSSPLFAVDLMLAGTDVVGNPQPAELYRLVIQVSSVNSHVSSTHS